MSTELNDSLFNDNSRKCSITYDDTSAGRLLMSIILLSNFVVGLPANVWTFWIICHGTREKMASEIHHLSLAVCEILYCLGLPAQLHCMYSFEKVSLGLYILLGLQNHLVWICRPVLQSIISAERYVAVVHPFIFIRFKHVKYKVAQCALSWCVVFLIVLLVWTLPLTAVILVVLIWLIPTLCFLFYCYLSVLFSLKRSGPGKRESSGGMRQRRDKIKRKAFNINLVHLLCFMFNYLPLTVLRFVVDIYFSRTVFDLTTGLGIVCGQVQPFFYLHRAGKLPCLKRDRPKRTPKERPKG